MSVPTYVPLSSTLTTIVMQLTPMTAFDLIGGYEVDSYHFQYALTNTWFDVQGQEGSLSMVTTVTTAELTGGVTYKFRVRARNIHGWGLWSDVVTEIASGLPETPVPVTVHIINLDVKIAWTAPNANFATITAYEITIVHSDASTFS